MFNFLKNKRAEELRKIITEQKSDLDKAIKKIETKTIEANNYAARLAISSMNNEIFDTERKDEYLEFLHQLDRQQNCQFLSDINGLPFNQYEFANFVYRYGSVMIVYNNSQYTYGIPQYVTWDYSNNPTKCRIIYMRYNSDGQIIEHKGNVYNKGEYFIFYDTMPRSNGVIAISRQQYMNVILDQMADIFARLNINITLATNKIVIEAMDVDTHASITQELKKQYGNSSPFIVVDTQRFGKQQPFETPNQNTLTEFFALIKQFDQVRQMFNGFGSGQYGIDKTERNVVNEVDVNQDSVALINAFRTQQKKLLESWLKVKNACITQQTKSKI